MRSIDLTQRVAQRRLRLQWLRQAEALLKADTGATECPLPGRDRLARSPTRLHLKFELWGATAKGLHNRSRS
jgi:hypothetical protein